MSEPGRDGEARVPGPAEGRGPGFDQAALNRAVRAEQVRFLYRTPVAMMVNLINAPIAAAVLAHAYPLALLVGWVALFVLVIPLRYLVWRAYHRRPAPAEEAGLWARRYLIGTAVTGCLWGLAGSIVFMTEEPAYVIFVAFVLSGMCAGAVASQAVYLPALAAFMIPALAPITLAFFTEGSMLSTGMGVLTLVFAAGLTLVGRGFHRALAETVRLELEKAALIRSLTEARDAAEAAAHAKSRFLAHMSHELRTPLNAIIGFSEMLAAEPHAKRPSPEFRTYGRYIHESANHLLALIKEILDLSGAETGSLTLEEAAVELPGLLDACLRMVAERAASGGLVLEGVPADALPRVWADAEKLRQILFNLLSNAIKFTPAGGVIRLAAALDERDAVSFSVSDTGIGMKPDDVAKALSPFEQLDGTLTRKYQGAGLGLTLAKHLAELHGGSLEIASRLGHGTTVTLRLPPSRSIRAAAAATPLANRA